MRDINIYHTATGQLNLSTRVKKPKKGKGLSLERENIRVKSLINKIH